MEVSALSQACPTREQKTRPAFGKGGERRFVNIGARGVPSVHVAVFVGTRRFFQLDFKYGSGLQ